MEICQGTKPHRQPPHVKPNPLTRGGERPTRQSSLNSQAAGPSPRRQTGRTGLSNPAELLLPECHRLGSADCLNIPPQEDMGERFQEQPSNKSATLVMALQRAQKKRPQKKEYQVMTDIMLLQVAAKNYTLEPEDPFWAWFQAMESLSEVLMQFQRLNYNTTSSKTKHKTKKASQWKKQDTVFLALEWRKATPDLGQEGGLGQRSLKDSHFQWLLLFLGKSLQPLNLRSSEGLSLLFAQIH
ncbi:uncharacterized protein LOC130543845 isoform X3 [Ursus arctos]|uniref:uncharacterized protein LOC130543845 isoform X3 n=1 Tax=Ursus arctos TaxID=9644 RepID=UPI0025486D64|nr:uncharacterized protein LOC130543845 isoform X3 [Ursus arctos]